MHRTLKEDTTRPPAASLRAQQSRFDNFRYVFNNERPHEGLNNQTPASLYYPSSVRLPRNTPEFTYPKGLLLRRVNNSGDISWHKNRVFISEVFRFEELGSSWSHRGLTGSPVGESPLLRCVHPEDGISFGQEATMAKLTTAEKKAEPKSDFGLPEERKYPMPDAAHARNAKARASQAENAGKLSAADKKKVDSKADKVLKEK